MDGSEWMFCTITISEARIGKRSQDVILQGGLTKPGYGQEQYNETKLSCIIHLDEYFLLISVVQRTVRKTENERMLRGVKGY